jgi:hypothetical protein
MDLYKTANEMKINSIKTGLFSRFIVNFLILGLPLTNGYKAILLILADVLDCNIVKVVKYFNNLKPDSSYCKHYLYQIGDKLLDSMSYVLIYKLLDLNPIYLFLIVYRLIGIYLFDRYQDSKYLIMFPDLFKEILAYDYYFGGFDKGIALVVLLKIIFEIFWHTIINKNSYKKKK